MSQACDPVATALLYKDGILAVGPRALEYPLDEVFFNLHVTRDVVAAWVTPFGGVCFGNFDVRRGARSLVFLVLLFDCFASSLGSAPSDY